MRRRNLNASQRAIAAAEAFDQVPILGTDGKRRDALASMFGASRSYVQQARALVERDPDAARAVKAGAKTQGTSRAASP